MHLWLTIHCWNQDSKRERAVAYLGCQEYRTLVHENRYQPNDGKSGQILMNPVLILFGYRLHEVEYHFIGNNYENLKDNLVFFANTLLKRKYSK